jgi:hypothetical protein
LKRAVNLVTKEGKCVAAAALACSVPNVTLLDKMNGKHKTGTVGRPCENVFIVNLNYRACLSALYETIWDFSTYVRKARKLGLFETLLWYGSLKGQ